MSQRCKQRGWTACRVTPTAALRITAGLLAGLLSVSACRMQPRVQLISVRALERAAPARPTQLGRSVAANVEPLVDLSVPLGPRLALIQVRNSKQWSVLQRAVPTLQSRPNFRRGTVIGLLSLAGTPLRPHWPLQLREVRVTQGAGLVTAHFAGGTYLPDGAAYLEAAYVPGLASVLVVEVNGVRFYPTPD